MNFDGGMGYILSAVIGSAVMWIFNRFDRHSDHSREANQEALDHAKKTADGAEDRVNRLEKDFLRYQAHVAENFYPKNEHRDFERAIFAKLDDIVKLINTKADKA